MKRFFIAIIYFFTMSFIRGDNQQTEFANPYKDSALTYELKGGRFGDFITIYIKAKWLAYKYQIPFYYRPFKDSDLLNAHTIENRFSGTIINKYKNKILVDSEYNIKMVKRPSLFYTKFHTKINTDKYFDLYEQVILHEEFDTELKKMIQPSIPVDKLDLPFDMITVAVHIRKGSGGDGPLFSLQEFSGHEHLVHYTTHEVSKLPFYDKNKRWFTKFPPEQFYIDQIKKLSELLMHQQLFVYLFSDFERPEVLLEKIQRAVNLPNIKFACHLFDMSYKPTMINDYYNMAQFDCLIRPVSSFSYGAQFLGKHSIIIYPQSGRWINNKLVMDRVLIIRDAHKKPKRYIEKICF